MAYKIELSEEAVREYTEAYIWYEEHQQGLGERFTENVEDSLQTIAIHPEYYSIRKYNYREARIKTFPYTIVYEIIKKEKLIHVAAIYHGKRNPIKKYRKRSV